MSKEELLLEKELLQKVIYQNDNITITVSIHFMTEELCSLTLDDVPGMTPIIKEALSQKAHCNNITNLFGIALCMVPANNEATIALLLLRNKLLDIIMHTTQPNMMAHANVIAQSLLLRISTLFPINIPHVG
jgi:hypothetical protein